MPELYTHTMVTPILIRDSEGDWVDIDDESYYDLMDAVKGDFEEMGPRGLAEYTGPNELKNVDSIAVWVEGPTHRPKAYTEIVFIVEGKPTDEEIEEAEDYVEGQFADGWGEGFEQYAFTDSDNYGLLYASFWWSGGWPKLPK